MSGQWLWSIGSEDRASADFLDNFKQSAKYDGVVWNVDERQRGIPQMWPLYHPSEADPEAGYRSFTHSIVFTLADVRSGAYLLRLSLLEIAPRLAHLVVRVNGAEGHVHVYPRPSRSDEIRLQSGLHTTIYAEDTLDVRLPSALLRTGENRIELTAVDGMEVLHVDRIEKIKRLDRMANGAGILYQFIAFAYADAKVVEQPARCEIVPSVLYRRTEAGGLVEKCYAYVELPDGAPDGGRLRLELDGSEQRYDWELPRAAFGRTLLQFEAADGQGTVRYRIAGDVGGLPFRSDGEFERRRKWNVYITPHAHTDIGYTHRQWEVAERLSRNIDTALDFLDREAGLADSGSRDTAQPFPFTYHLDSSWAVEQFVQTRGEEQVKRLLHWIRAGRISVAGNYVDLLTQFAALEDLIRNGEFTDALLRPHGMKSELAAVVDVASISGSVPALYEGSGIRYLVHANNQDRGPFRLNGGLHRLSPFYWEGTNGGRVLCWLAKMYCELRKVCGSPPMPNAAERGLEMWLQEYEIGEYAPDAVLLYGQEADNTDLDPQPIDFVKEWNGMYAYPKLIACEVSEFFEYVETQFGDTLRTVKGDGGAYWEDGEGSSMQETIQARHAQAMLPAAERLESLAVVHNGRWQYPEPHYDEAWRELLLYDEHTWGAFLSATEPDALLAHDQWKVKAHMAHDAHQWATRLLHAAATRHSLSWNNDGREVVVYNPHSWPICGSVTVEIAPNEQAYDPLTGGLVPMRAVRTLPSQMVVELWVEELQGLSYRRFVLLPDDGSAPRDVGLETSNGVAGAVVGAVTPGEHSLSLAEHESSASAASGTDPDRQATGAVDAGSLPELTPLLPLNGRLLLENRFYVLELDLGKGCAIRWFDKELDRELIDREHAWGFGQLLYARGGEGTRLMSNQSDLPDGNPDVSGTFKLNDYETERYAFGQRVVLRGEAPAGPLAIEWQLSDTDKRIDVRFVYDKEERRQKEAVYVAFPTTLNGAEVQSDSQLGWVNWDKDQLPGGCKEWLPLQTGILAETSGAAVFIASPDVPLFCVGEVVQGHWPKEKDLTGGAVFSYVLNNYWHTNYKGTQGGRFEFAYRLTSGPRLAKADMYRFGWEARRPLYAQRMSFQDFRDTSAPYKQPEGGSLAQIGGESVVLSTMKKAKWADGFIVRLQEIAGIAGAKANIVFPGRPILRSVSTDLLEREGDPLKVNTDGSLTVEVPAWGLATVRIEFA